MNFTRRSKIARLPLTIRQELNRRLDNGAPGKDLAAWLNALPEAQAIVTVKFHGQPITEQNLSEWRKGGYREWQSQQESLEAAERLGGKAAQQQAGGGPPMTQTMAQWTATRYALAARRVAKVEGREGWRMLREMCGDIVALRRGDLYAQRLDLERQRLAASKPAAHGNELR